MDKQIKLSACIITRNEANYLEQCLKSIINIVDEIILVDTGSSDNTIEIAKKYNSIIFYYDWNEDFSAARNFSISKASGTHILIIDSDEELSNPISIKKSLSKSDSSIGAWTVNIVSNLINKFGSENLFTGDAIRLFLNKPEFKFNGNVHEQIINSVVQNNYKIAKSDVIILHKGYSISYEEMNKKLRRNLKLLQLSLNEEPNNSFLLFSTGKTLYALKQFNEALKLITKALDYSKNNRLFTIQILNFLALIYFEEKNQDMAFSVVSDSLLLFSEQVFANYILSEIYFNKKEYQNALKYLENIENISKKGNITRQLIGDINIAKDEVLYKIALCYLNTNSKVKAKEILLKAHEVNHKNYKILSALAKYEFENGNYNESLDYLNIAYQISGNNKNIMKFIELVKSRLISEKNDFSNSIKHTLSLCMIVKNEELHLTACLESVKNVVDEIIIVDTGSIDKTKEIAQNYNCKIYDFLWVNDFAVARNESIKHSTKDWILYLDADERLTPYSASIIKKLLSNASDDIGAFLITIESEHKKADGTTEIHRGGYPRLFRNYGYPRIKFIGNVHEQISPSIYDLGKNIAITDLVIKHIGYNISVEAMSMKIKRNYSMLLQHINNEPTNGYAWFQLGQTLGLMQLKNESEEAFKFSIQCGNLSKPIYASAAASLSQLLGNQKKFDEALYWAEASINAIPEQIFAYHLKAFLLYYLKRYKESEELFIEIINRNKEFNGMPKASFEVEIPDKILYDGLAKVKEKLKINN